MLHIEEPTLAELLNEPIVRKLMARDRVSPRQVCAIAVAARCRIENSVDDELAMSARVRKTQTPCFAPGNKLIVTAFNPLSNA
jgi:hypothetical protein